MMKQVSTGLIIFGMLLVALSPALPGNAQTPYWDNTSNGDQSFYTPTNPGYNSGGSGYYGGNSNQYNNQSQYGQPNTYGQSGYGQNSYGQQPPALKGYISTAPAGTTMTATNTTYIASDTARIGDPVSVTLGYDLAMGGSIVLPAGTQIQGEVVSSIPAGRTGRQGQLQLRFNRAMLPDGRQVPLSARLITQDGTGILRGGTGMERAGGYAKNTLGGAALGAATGALLGAIKGGGKTDDYLARGAVLGGGLGLGRSIVQRGDEAELQPGTQLQIMLDQPLTLGTGGGQGSPYGSGGYPY